MIILLQKTITKHISKMIEVFDFNDTLLNINVCDNNFTIKRKLISKINQLSYLYNLKKIKTSSKIISVLSDDPNYFINNLNFNVINSSNGLIHYGFLFGKIEIYLDSNQKWDDDKIYPIYDPLIIRSYKINKIRYKNDININILDYIEIKNLLW